MTLWCSTWHKSNRIVTRCEGNKEQILRLNQNNLRFISYFLCVCVPSSVFVVHGLVCRGGVKDHCSTPAGPVSPRCGMFPGESAPSPSDALDAAPVVGTGYLHLHLHQCPNHDQTRLSNRHVAGMLLSRFSCLISLPAQYFSTTTFAYLNQGLSQRP